MLCTGCRWPACCMCHACALPAYGAASVCCCTSTPFHPPFCPFPLHFTSCCTPPPSQFPHPQTHTHTADASSPAAAYMVEAHKCHEQAHVCLSEPVAQQVAAAAQDGLTAVQRIKQLPARTTAPGTGSAEDDDAKAKPGQQGQVDVCGMTHAGKVCECVGKGLWSLSWRQRKEQLHCC